VDKGPIGHDSVSSSVASGGKIAKSSSIRISKNCFQ
jgi:hypothetical protein